jgi:hypothetical protein
VFVLIITGGWSAATAQKTNVALLIMGKRPMPRVITPFVVMAMGTT